MRLGLVRFRFGMLCGELLAQKIFFWLISLCLVLSGHKISDFRAMYRLRKERSSASDFECFVGAIRVTRAWGEMASNNKSIFRLLLNGTMAFPGAVAVIEQFGLREPIRKWISGYLGVGFSAERESQSDCSFFSNERELAYQCEKAEPRRMQFGDGLRWALFTL